MQLRVLDAGSVGALRSQALWHGIAAAMQPDDGPTLSLCSPSEPYVSIGYHRGIDEVDLVACAADGLPVVRRQIGGGPVYLDSDQLLFQLTVGVRLAPRSLDRLYRDHLGPAVDAFRRLGLDARLDGLNDIVVGDRKISGTGAGQIGDAVTVVGNVMLAFPHARMARVLALPDERMRSECLRLMRRHVSSLSGEGCSADLGEAGRALVDCYARAFGGEPAADELRPSELEAIARWERRLGDPGWTAGPDLPQRSARQVKVRSDVWVVQGHSDGTDVLATFAAGRLERVVIEDARVNGTAGALAQALTGAAPDAGQLRARLEPFGDAGRRVVEAIESGLVVR